MTPTQAALKFYRDKGWVVEVVEKFVRSKGGGFRKDLFGFADLLAYNTQLRQTAAIQCTDGTNAAARRNKILTEKKAVEWLACGNKIFLCLRVAHIVRVKTGKNKGAARKAYEVRDIDIVI